MRVVVSDTSCLIDLRKVSLLDIFLSLPYEFLIPNTMFDEELLSFTAAEKDALLARGLRTADLPGESVLRAQVVRRHMPQLSVHDAFAFILAENCPGCILLTGDGKLRALAEPTMEVRGVLWAIDQLYDHGVASAAALHAALLMFASDRSVHLPRAELGSSLRRYQGRE